MHFVVEFYSLLFLYCWCLHHWYWLNAHTSSILLKMVEPARSELMSYLWKMGNLSGVVTWIRHRQSPTGRQVLEECYDVKCTSYTKACRMDCWVPAPALSGPHNELFLTSREPEDAVGRMLADPTCLSSLNSEHTAGKMLPVHVKDASSDRTKAERALESVLLTVCFETLPRFSDPTQ